MYSFFAIHRQKYARNSGAKVDDPLKADRALSKLNFLFHLKSKNLITFWKCNSHLQYYKINLSFRIKEYKTEREARDPNRTEREAQWPIRAP